MSTSSQDLIIKPLFELISSKKLDINTSSLVETGLNLTIYQPNESMDCILSVAIYKNHKRGTYLSPDYFGKIMSFIENIYQEVQEQKDLKEPYLMPNSYYTGVSKYTSITRKLGSHRITVFPVYSLENLLTSISSIKFKRFAEACGIKEIVILVKTSIQDSTIYLN